jgi:hypothetical protein
MRSDCSARKDECLHQLFALGSLVDEKDKDVGTAYLSRFFGMVFLLLFYFLNLNIFDRRQ